MRIINIVTLAQIVSWGVFVFGDYISETFSNDLLLMAALLLLPVIIPVAYLIFQKKIGYKTISKWVNTLTALVVWGAENFIFAWIVGGVNIVPQAHDKWEDMLNGIEYALFPVFNIAGALIVVGGWSMGLLVYRRFRGRD